MQDVARGHLLADERGRIGERYILGNRNFTMTRLFADLGRLSGVEPPAVKLPVPVALALTAGRRLRRRRPADARRGPGGVAELGVLQPQGQARAAAGSTSPHEDCLEETIAWYRERDAASWRSRDRASRSALRLAGEAIRHLPG